MNFFMPAHAKKQKNTPILSILTMLMCGIIVWSSTRGACQNKWPPLHTAVFSGNLNTVTELLIKGTDDINAKDDKDWTALHWAIFNENIKIVQVLLAQQGIDINAQNNCGSTPLHCAIIKNNLQIVKQLLIKKNIDVNIKDRCGSTPLCKAAVDNNTQIVKELLNVDRIDVDAPDNFNLTPLNWAASNGNSMIVKLLLDHHADPSIASKQGSTPLRRAQAKSEQCQHKDQNYITIIKLLEHAEKKCPLRQALKLLKIKLLQLAAKLSEKTASA